MYRRTTLAPGTLVGVALGGVLAGHTLTYRILEPDAHQRAAALNETGHAYLHVANALGIASIVVTLAAVFLSGVLGRREVERRQVFARLCGFQVAAFCAMEILERLTAHAGLDHVGTVIFIGVPAQLLVATVICGLITLVLRAGRAVTGLPRKAVAARPALVLAVVEPSLLRAPDVHGRATGRAPPVRAV